MCNLPISGTLSAMGLRSWVVNLTASNRISRMLLMRAKRGPRGKAATNRVRNPNCRTKNTNRVIKPIFNCRTKNTNRVRNPNCRTRNTQRVRTTNCSTGTQAKNANYNGFTTQNLIVQLLYSYWHVIKYLIFASLLFSNSHFISIPYSMHFLPQQGAHIYNYTNEMHTTNILTTDIEVTHEINISTGRYILISRYS